MPNPKRQHSKQRSRKRRTHWKVRMASLNPCSNCASMIVPHRVCPFCGYYKGKPVVEIEAKLTKKEKERARQAANAAQ
jgi:large subunit ribosomal protein L32